MRKIAIASVMTLGFATSAQAFGEGNEQTPTQGRASEQQPSRGQSAPERTRATAATDIIEYSELDAAQVRALQRKLRDAGHYTYNIDGIVGPKTITALQNFQAQNELAGNGALTDETAEALGLDMNAIEPVSGRDEADDEQGMPMRPQSGAGTAGMEAEAGTQTGAGTRAMQPGADTTRQAPSEEQAVSLSTLGEQQTMQLQRRLKELGYYKGEIDGIAGGGTRAALQQFYNAQARLAANGRIGQEAASALGIDLEVEPVGGVEQEMGETH